MIKSMNRELDENAIIYIEALDEREENLCLWNACGVAGNLGCGGQACAIACIGISVCLLGLHTL